jgi:GDPmannose 4,6-dehydratase
MIEIAFGFKGFNIKWKGEGINEIGFDEKTGRELVSIDERYFRPVEVEQLLGDPSKAKEKLAWIAKTDICELLREMVENDC